MIEEMITGGMPDMRGAGHDYGSTKKRNGEHYGTFQKKRFQTVNWSDGKGEFT
jgi:hypothetical protein